MSEPLMSDQDQPSEDRRGTPENLWPTDLGDIDALPPTPVQILREQAAMLSDSTGRVLEGEVISEADDYDHLVHSLFIRAPALDGYRYRLISLSHDADKPYPVHVVYDASQAFDIEQPASYSYTTAIENSSIQGETRLRERLKKTFSRPLTLELIKSLRAQSRAAAVP
jgi:hypothetical protein